MRLTELILISLIVTGCSSGSNGPGADVSSGKIEKASVSSVSSNVESPDYVTAVAGSVSFLFFMSPRNSNWSNRTTEFTNQNDITFSLVITNTSGATISCSMSDGPMSSFGVKSGEGAILWYSEQGKAFLAIMSPPFDLFPGTITKFSSISTWREPIDGFELEPQAYLGVVGPNFGCPGVKPGVMELPFVLKGD